MKTIKILACFFCGIILNFTTINSQAQATFENYYNNNPGSVDYLRSVIETQNGDIVFAGMFHDGPNNLNRGSILKVNSQGDTIWSKLFRGTYQPNFGSDYFNKVILTGSGGFYSTGTRNTGSLINSNSNEDIWSSEIDDNGNLLNDYNYNSGGLLSDWGYSIVKSISSGYLLVGKGSIPATMTSPAIPYGLIIKTNNAGAVVWSNIGGSNYSMNYIRDAITTNDGGYIVCGYGGNTPIVKYDSNGGIIWQCNLGDDKSLYSLKSLNNNNIIVVGLKFYSSSNTTNRYYTIIGQSGNIIDEVEFDDTNVQYQGTGFQDCELYYSVSKTSDGGFVACGTVNTDLSFYTKSIIDKFDASGNLLWTKWFEGVGDAFLYDIRECSDGGIITCGSINGEQYACKMDSYGNGCNSVSIINELKSSNNYQIYPNPSNGNLTVQLSEQFKNSRVIIFNQLGQILFSEILNQKSQTLNLKSLPQGIYFLKVEIQDGNFIVKKIAIE